MSQVPTEGSPPGEPMKRRRGRPFLMREAPVTAHQEGLIQKEAEKIKEIDDLMKKHGFMSIRQYLQAYFGNKHFKKGQTFFLRHGAPTGFEATLDMWLKDDRLEEMPRSLVMENWMIHEALYEFDSLLDDKHSCLRHMSRESIEDGFQAVQLEDFYAEVQENAPMLWRLFTTLGQKKTPSKKRKIDEPGEDVRGDLVALTSLLNLLYSRNQQANGLQSLMSIYYKAQGTHKQALETLHRTGMVVSYTESNRTLHEVADNVSSQLKKDCQMASHLISVDNVNQQIRSTENRLDHKSYMDNSTAGYAFLVQGLPEGEKFVRRGWLKRGARRELSSLDMAPDDSVVLRTHQEMKANIMDVVQNFMKDQGGIKDLNRKKYLPHVTVKRLPIEATKISTFPLAEAEQMSVIGNKESLTIFLQKVMGLDFFDLSEELVLSSGDQLTMDRWRSLMKLTDTEPLSERFDFILPIPGLFHTKQTYMKMSASNHWGDSVLDASSITAAQAKLHREKIDKNCSDLWAMKSLTGHMLEGQILSLLAAEWKVFTLEDLAERCKDVDDTVKCINTIADKYLIYDAVLKLRKKAVRDIVFENGLLSVRHGLWVHAFHESVAIGDIGRVKDLLDIWTPCFLGSHHYKYAIEMLEIQCGFKSEWTPGLQEIILRNWLVNPPGLANHFLPVDEFQEECVRMLKHIHNPGGSERVGEFMRETLARLLCVFMNIKRSIKEVTGGIDYRSGHTRSDSRADVKALFDIGVDIPGEDEANHGMVKPAVDWYQEGLGVLTEGKYWHGFLGRSTKGLHLQYRRSYEENQDEEADNEGGEDEDEIMREYIFDGALTFEE
ncbi:hypothetical protein L211DRAFT_847316 [Terfezia boudieri ATCC MYA-4762]|uniref:DUF6589 domain-containing protein n=1 Tax=Terfezia boudieri ATCC MYA-4762 TaxID=1051890 RepID=A0A3N4LZP8_9PEZI|nr:hypothetical protein L211DRAFT_847316 [Terfezia boudieri ATCC MYA-4762]